MADSLTNIEKQLFDWIQRLTDNISNLYCYILDTNIVWICESLKLPNKLFRQ